MHTIKALVGGAVREVTHEGRPHIAVPAIILTNGVHNGIYYPEEENAKYPESWNGRPITVYHPQFRGQMISANIPVVLEKRAVGKLFATRHEKWTDGEGVQKSGIKTELWVDVAKCNSVDPDIVPRLKDGKSVMELSTGLFTDDDVKPGKWNDEDFRLTAHNYRPDHLALLPDLIGACSVADGAGAPRVNAASDCEQLIPVFITLAEMPHMFEVKQAMPPTHKYVRHGTQTAVGVDVNGMKKHFKMTRTEAGALKLNDMSAMAHQDKLRMALVQSKVAPMFNSSDGTKVAGVTRAWVSSDRVFPNEKYFIYDVDGKQFRQGYHATANEDVALDGKPVEVTSKTQWVPKTNEQHNLGGAGSGNFGHEGRIGEVGGSGGGGAKEAKAPLVSAAAYRASERAERANSSNALAAHIAAIAAHKAAEAAQHKAGNFKSADYHAKQALQHSHVVESLNRGVKGNSTIKSLGGPGSGWFGLHRFAVGQSNKAERFGAKAKANPTDRNKRLASQAHQAAYHAHQSAANLGTSSQHSNYFDSVSKAQYHWKEADKLSKSIK